mmetsp:Transcript_52251/g.156805  ORF Transcript_52251/g.156805 Transcript_52251/m.156805 type:complete len:206 (+) Transcript_52251:357-974(+)
MQASAKGYLQAEGGHIQGRGHQLQRSLLWRVLRHKRVQNRHRNWPPANLPGTRDVGRGRKQLPSGRMSHQVHQHSVHRSCDQLSKAARRGVHCERRHISGRSRLQRQLSGVLRSDHPAVQGALVQPPHQRHLRRGGSARHCLYVQRGRRRRVLDVQIEHHHSGGRLLRPQLRRRFRNEQELQGRGRYGPVLCGEEQELPHPDPRL